MHYVCRFITTSRLSDEFSTSSPTVGERGLGVTPLSKAFLSTERIPQISVSKFGPSTVFFKLLASIQTYTGQ